MQAARLRSAIVVRGSLLQTPGQIITRCKRPQSDGTMPSLGEARHHWQCMDLDSVPNLGRFKLPDDAEQAIAFVSSLLPIEIQCKSRMIEWSSSAGIAVGTDGAPDCLSVHLWIWTDEPTVESATRSLHRRLDEYVRHQLAVRGHNKWHGKVDPSVGLLMQPIYIAPPLCLGGLRDPFEDGARLAFIDGEKGDVVSLSALLAELPLAPGSDRKPSTGTDNIVDLSAERDRRSSVTHSGLRSTKLQAHRRQFAIGAVDDILRLVAHRVASGATDPRYMSWTAAGGVPDGNRDLYTLILSSQIAVGMTDADILAGALMPAIENVAAGIVDPDWFQQEWLGCGYYRAVVERANAAARGETVLWNGRKVDPRYTYTATRIIEEFGITCEEMLTLRLRHLVTPEIRAKIWRRERGSVPLEKIRAAAHRYDDQIRCLRAKGLSIREMAAQLGIDRGVVDRAIARIGLRQRRADTEAYAPLQRERVSVQENIIRLPAAPSGTEPRVIRIESAYVHSKPLTLPISLQEFRSKQARTKEAKLKAERQRKKGLRKEAAVRLAKFVQHLSQLSPPEVRDWKRSIWGNFDTEWEYRENFIELYEDLDSQCRVRRLRRFAAANLKRQLTKAQEIVTDLRVLRAQ